MPREFVRTFQVREYECDQYGHVNNANYLRYMQQAAVEASADAGYDSRRYQALGTLWLIRETGIEYLRPILPEQVVQVRTWVADFRRIVSRRRYVLSVDGEQVAAAYSDWVYVERQTQRPVRIPQEMALAFMPEGGGEVIERSPMPSPPLPAEPVTIMHRVEWGDLDGAGHVNNAVYLSFLEEAGIRAGEAAGWGMQAMAAKGLAVVARAHRIQYLLPGLHGDSLKITTWLTDVRRVSALRHFMIQRATDGTLLLRANTRLAFLNRQTMAPTVLPETVRQAFAPQTA